MPAEADLKGGITDSVAVILPDSLTVVALNGSGTRPGLLQPDTFLKALGLVFRERLRESPRYANAVITLFNNRMPHPSEGYSFAIRFDSIQIGHELKGSRSDWWYFLQQGMFLSAHAKAFEKDSVAPDNRSTFRVADNFLLTDSLFWIAEASSMELAVKQLPAGKDIFWDLGFTLAGKVAERYSPLWRTERRVMMLSSPASYLAYDKLQAGNPEEALKLLQSLLTKTKNRSRDASTHLNISVVYEYMDQLQPASQAAEKAKQLNPGSSLYRKQAESLRLRALTREKLVRQME